MKSLICCCNKQEFIRIMSIMSMFQIVFSFFFVLCLIKPGVSLREKRALVYPRKISKVQVIAGTGVPIPSENHAITMGWVIKAQYLLPTNSTYYTDPYVVLQKRSLERKISRYDLYRNFEVAAEIFKGGGKECMLRNICEASRIPLKASGLVGQILKILLLPSSTNEVPLNRYDMEYHRAESLGKEKNVNCQSLFPSCSYSLIQLLTVIA